MKFNIRVYGLLLNESGQVLVADEWLSDRFMVKFPGGGLEPGEGLADALLREWKEETGADISITDHFYTTDFYQRSAFHDDQQLISIYYRVALDGEPDFLVERSQQEMMAGALGFRWMAVDEHLAEELTWPIDKKVAEMLDERI